MGRREVGDGRREAGSGAIIAMTRSPTWTSSAHQLPFASLLPPHASLLVKIITFNANGIRSAANKGFFDWLRKQNADVVCLQETKSAFCLRSQSKKPLLAAERMPLALKVMIFTSREA